MTNSGTEDLDFILKKNSIHERIGSDFKCNHLKTWLNKSCNNTAWIICPQNCVILHNESL